MKEDKGTTVKITTMARDFNNNVRSTRRSKRNGIVIDKQQLTQSQTWDLIVYYFEKNPKRFQELINMENKKDVRS